nr:11841_t:CDS:2 [Entrophospora candida]
MTTNDKQVESTQKKTNGKRKFVEWSEEDDLKLTGCFEKYGSDWRKIKDELGCNRSLEQIRKRARHLNLNKPKRTRKTVNNNTSSNKTPIKKTKIKATTPNTTPTKARSRLIPILPAGSAPPPPLSIPNNHQFSSTSHSSSNINLLSDGVDDNTTKTLEKNVLLLNHVEITAKNDPELNKIIAAFDLSPDEANKIGPDYHSVYTYLSWSLKYNSRDLIDERMDIGKVILKSFIDHLINNTNELFTQRQRKFIMQKLYLLKQALTPGGNEKITIESSTLSNPLSIPSDLLKSMRTRIMIFSCDIR